MSLQPVSLPPRWLPLRLLLGGIIAAAVVLLSRHHDWNLQAPAAEFWLRCGSSFVVLATSLLLALCIAVFLGLRARRIGPRTERFIALLGRALACVPAVVWVWGFLGGWIGRLGWPVESLVPVQFPGSQDSLRVLLAHGLWEFLAPSFILALPLCGEMIHAIIVDGRSVVDLDFSLRARGVPRSSRLWLHHLRQLRPLLRVRLQSLCLIAPVHLIIIEDALHFMGWGEGLAQRLRAGDSPGIALGLVVGAAMLALLCACLHLLRGRLHSAHRWVVTLAWQPWLLWALGLLALLPSSFVSWIILWAAMLASGSAGWRQTWRQIVVTLPLEAARMLGAPEPMIWRHHIALVQCRMLLSWIFALLAQTTLAIAAACALLPRLLDALGGPLAQLYRPLAISSGQEAMQTLADPTALLQSGACIALAALCFSQLSRILQPRLS